MSFAHARQSISMTTTRYSKYFISTCLEYERKLALHTLPVHHSTFQTILTYLHILKIVLRIFHTEQTKCTLKYKQHVLFGGGGWVGIRVLDTENARSINLPLPPPRVITDVVNRSMSLVCLEPLTITFTSHLSNLT